LEVRERYNAPREVESFKKFLDGEPDNLEWAESWAVSIGHGDTVLRDQLIEDLDRLLPV
jgi:hypothetical protein